MFNTSGDFTDYDDPNIFEKLVDLHHETQYKDKINRKNLIIINNKDSMENLQEIPVKNPQNCYDIFKLNSSIESE